MLDVLGNNVSDNYFSNILLEQEKTRKENKVQAEKKAQENEKVQAEKKAQENEKVQAERKAQKDENMQLEKEAEEDEKEKEPLENTFANNVNTLAIGGKTKKKSNLYKEKQKSRKKCYEKLIKYYNT